MPTERLRSVAIYVLRVKVDFFRMPTYAARRARRRRKAATDAGTTIGETTATGEHGMVPNAIWIGDAALPEFAAAANVLRRRFSAKFVASFDDALRDVANDVLIAVVAEAFPYQCWTSAAEEFRRRRPITPVVRLIGPGCDGELRTRPPAPVLRCHWLEAAAWLERESESLERDECPAWGLPATWNSEDRLLAELPPTATSLQVDRQFAVAARDPAVATWLGEAAVRFGIGGGKAASRSEPRVVLWQAPPDMRAEQTELAELRRTYPKAEIAAFVAFPRPEDRRRLAAAGVDCIASLPVTPETWRSIAARFSDSSATSAAANVKSVASHDVDRESH